MALMQLCLICGNQHHVEFHLGYRAGKTVLCGRLGALNRLTLNHQLLACGEGEVIKSVFITGNIDLGGEVLEARLGDEIMDVRRALAMPTQEGMMLWAA